MRNIISACFVITGLLLVLSQERWVRQVFADNCNYAIQAANPNPCASASFVRCSSIIPCKDGFTSRPNNNTSNPQGLTPCGPYSYLYSGLVAQQLTSGTQQEKSVSPKRCFQRLPCVVNQVKLGHCTPTGQIEEDASSLTYAADCCDGSIVANDPDANIDYIQKAVEACDQ